LRAANVGVEVVIDTHSSTQDANLDWLISEHNKRTRDRDVSIHFNSDGTTNDPRGTEAYYASNAGHEIAADVSSLIAIASGLKDRGAKDGSHLKWVRETEMPAVLCEVAFVNSKRDVELYRQHYEDICRAIAEGVGDVSISGRPPQRPEGPPIGGTSPWDVPIERRPELSEGDNGDDVTDLQFMIPRFGGDVDGDFGPYTDERVRDYQRSRDLDADGIVGEQTWTALYERKPPVVPEPPPHALSMSDQVAIIAIAKNSRIASYSWADRGVAPEAYTCGMALAFAQTYRKLKANHPAAIEISKPRTESDKDALNLYGDDFEELGLSNENGGAETLRNLYALMLGSGMRESSGIACTGRDQSAGDSSMSSDTCEAGLFQTSWNAHSASDPEFEDLMTEYSNPANEATCYYNTFYNDIECSDEDWDNYGSGDGYDFQKLCKDCPPFAAETHGLTLRNLCNHYGPIIRHETELRADAEAMFRTVQDYVDESEPAEV
jgi:peptidoglycan hydrolase-like protein with peptidoglycan-binding domain